MMRGIYTSTSSLLALLKRQESMSHNLANVETPGFKQEILVAKEGDAKVLTLDSSTSTGYTIGTLDLGVDSSQLQTDYSQGPLENTGQPLDVAITGDGFFRVQTPNGIQLTRDGTFRRDRDGYLVTSQGYYVLGDNGRIHLPEGSPYIADDGNIYVNGATPVGRISLAHVADPSTLQPGSDNLLDPANAQVTPLTAAQTKVKQRYLEQANVDVSGSVVGMMAALRSYEATQRALKLQDEALQKTMEIGRSA
jgi:flagellar basal-body rod protein FlgF